MRPLVMPFALLLLATQAVRASEPVPEIKRDAATPQAVGALHTLRGIPEACARLEGQFTGDPAQPYRFDVVRTSPNCQARARFVDAAKAKPSAASGWILNDVIRVPSVDSLLSSTPRSPAWTSRAVKVASPPARPRACAIVRAARPAPAITPGITA